MSLRSLEFAVAESFTAIRRNGFMSFASVVTVALTLAVLGGFVLFVLGLHSVTETELQKFEIQVFMKMNTSQAQIQEVRSKIENLSGVGSVRYISATDGWKEFKARMGERIDMSGVKGNPLPDSFRVKITDPHNTVMVAKLIREMPRIDEVVEGQQLVDQVLHFSDLVKIIGGIATLLLFFITAFLVSNTIRLMIYARRREIRIMQLVGATNWFIRLPLIFEGTILGAIGGGIACGMIFVSSHYLSEWVLKMMPMLGQFSSHMEPLWFFGGLVGLGWIIGAMGSLISIQRFLKA